MLVETMGHFVKTASPAPSAPLVEWCQYGVTTPIPNLPQKAFAVWQAVGYGVSDLMVVPFDPQLLKGNDVMVRAGKRVGYGCDALLTVLRDIFQAPARIA